MEEIDKHYLRYDRPLIYECTCGVVAFYDRVAGEFVVDRMPAREVEYLKCGHAACAHVNPFDCIICAMLAGALDM